MWFRLGMMMGILLFVGCATQSELPVVPQPEFGKVGDAFAGLSLRDADDGGALVSWVMAGPLEGEGFTSPNLQRGDIILETDGQVLDAEQFKNHVKTKRPGETLLLKVRRTEGNVNAGVPTPGEGKEEVLLSVVLGHRSEWTGPVHADTPADRVLPVIGDEMPKLEAWMRQQATEQGQMEDVQKLVDLFAETQVERQGGNLLSHVSYGFHEPLRMPQLVEKVANPMRNLRRDARQVLREGAILLDAAVPELPEKVVLDGPDASLQQVAALVLSADRELEIAFEKADPLALAALPGVVDTYMTSWDLRQDDPKGVAKALRSTLDVDFGALMRAAAALSPVMEKWQAPKDIEVGEAFEDFITADRSLLGRVFGERHPLAEAVTGNVLAVQNIDGRWYVYGGPGENTYDLSRIDVVIDPAGNDTYTYSKEERPVIQVVIDMGGNDTYSGEPFGVASARLGLSVVVDVAGDDSYRGTRSSIGSCVMGIGLLLDYSGNDVYRGGSWSIGCGVYGIGAVMDMGGSDVYWADHSSEALGGPRGLGLIYEAGGTDLYRANGPTKSGYGTPAVFYGLSQGVGFGFRGYDTGGIGLLMDRGGMDRYEAGEFSQGGGYYWGLGIIDEGTGADLYYGNRYGQGFGCHQALGVLLDHQGDDTYWTMSAADQGGAWDIGMGMLLDKEGNDTYRAMGLSQGGASMQGIAWHIDLAGKDHRMAAGKTSQGHGGGNSYHYERTGCVSWSVLVDAGGDADVYSGEGRKDNVTLTPGADNEKKPENTMRHGLFIDMKDDLEVY